MKRRFQKLYQMENGYEDKRKMRTAKLIMMTGLIKVMIDDD